MIESKFKNTEIGLIPEDWEVKTIGDFCDITTGAQNTQDKIDNGKYPFYVRSQQVERIDNYLFDTEGVITAGDGVGTGKIFHYVNGKFGLHQRCYLMHNFDTKVFAKYFFMVFSRDFYERVQSMTAKSSVDSVRREMIADMPIPLPPLPEQRRIAEVLSEADELIKQWENVIAKKRDIKTGTMQLLLTGKKRLNGFKDEWVEKKLGEVCSNMTDGPFGSDLKTQHYTEEKQVRVIQLSNVGDNGWADENTKYTTFEHAKTLSRCIVEPGSVLIAKMMPAGRAIICPGIDKQYILGSDCVKVVVDDNYLLSKFFIYFTKSDYYLNQIAENTQGSTRQRTSITKLKGITVLLPTLTEQRAIAEILSDMDEEIKTLEQKVEKLRNIKSGMMQQLLSGKIRLVDDEADNVRQFVENNFGPMPQAAEEEDRFGK